MENNQDTLKESFAKQCWWTWSEGFRYSYREYRAISEANLLTEAFEKKFNTEGK